MLLIRLSMVANTASTVSIISSTAWRDASARGKTIASCIRKLRHNAWSTTAARPSKRFFRTMWPRHAAWSINAAPSSSGGSGGGTFFLRPWRPDLLGR